MSLLERIDMLQGKVTKLKTAHSNVDEVQRLQIRLDEVKAIAQPLAQQIKLLKRFYREKIQLSQVPDTVEKAVKKIETIQERFGEDPTAASLTKGQDWTWMKKYTKLTTESVEKSLVENWRTFVISSYSGEKPQNLERTLAPTESNKNAFTRYKVGYEKLSRLARSMPESTEQFDDVRNLAVQLKETYEEFDFDVPEVVNEFLRAVGSGGANLDQLTDEVRKWLGANETTGHYQIVARR